MIKATMAPSIGAAEQSTVRESRHDADRTSDGFAAVLAGAMHTRMQAHKHVHEKPKHETSELDAPKAHHDDDASTTTERAEKARNASAVAATSSSEVVRSVAALDPELQAKLARVTSRMRDETGKEVKVDETYRSQTRQDALYAQGRETPGPVVTWTQSSKHTQGRAVDVLLEGNASPDAYSILQRIAQEEGLHTLGAIDPGHLELPGAAAATGETSLNPAAPANATASIAQLAQLAPVAQTAQVARVASVARVNLGGAQAGAQPNVKTLSTSALSAQANGAVTNLQANVDQSAKNANLAQAVQASVDGADDADSSGVPPITATSTTQGPKAPVANVQGPQTESAGSQSGGQKFGTDSGDRGSDKGGDGRGYGALDAAFAMREQPSARSSIHGVTSATGISSAERAARIMAAIDDAPVRPLSQITMNVDAGNGTTDRIQVGLRGSSLNATIDTVDIGGARAMSARSDELVRALSRDGVEVESLRVRATATATPVLAPQNSRGSSDSSNSTRSERGNQWQEQDKQRSDTDRRQQQRDKRGGYTQ